jgi:tRNA (Thr-GGU) A37 N-methylase
MRDGTTTLGLADARGPAAAGREESPGRLKALDGTPILDVKPVLTDVR